MVDGIQVIDSSSLDKLVDLSHETRMTSTSAYIEGVTSLYSRSFSKLFKRSNPLKCLSSGSNMPQTWKFYLDNSNEKLIMMMDLIVRSDSLYQNLKHSMKSSSTHIPIHIEISENDETEANRVCKLYEIETNNVEAKVEYMMETFINRTKTDEKLNQVNEKPIKDTLYELRFICPVKEEYYKAKRTFGHPYLIEETRSHPGLIVINFDGQFDRNITICSWKLHSFSPFKCGIPARYPNTIVKDTKRSTDNSKVFRVTYSCKNNYFLDRHEENDTNKYYMYCGTDGDWIEEIPKCIPNGTESYDGKFFMPVSSTTKVENQQSSNTPIVVIGIFASLFIIGGVAVGVIFRKMKRKLDENMVELTRDRKTDDFWKKDEDRYQSVLGLYEEINHLDEGYDEVRINDLLSNEDYDDLKVYEHYMEMGNKMKINGNVKKEDVNYYIEMQADTVNID